MTEIFGLFINTILIIGFMALCGAMSDMLRSIFARVFNEVKK